MAVLVSINGVSYSIPSVGAKGWGTVVTNYLSNMASVCLFTGQSNPLIAELDLGPNYGVKSTYFKSRTSNPAAAGIVRLANTDNVSWRNAANNADLPLTTSASNRLTYNAVNVPTISSTDTLTNKTFDDATVKFADTDDTTKDLFFSLGGATADKTMTIILAQTEDRSLTLPDATDTLVGKATTDTFTNKTFNANGTGNSISNLETADFATNVIDTDGSLAANSDTRIASQKAGKTYADTKLATASFTDAAVTGKLITGFTSGAGTVAASDTILQAINKLDGNDGTKLNSSAFTDAAVTGKLITGYSSGAGTVAGTDTILQAINKLNGNDGNKLDSSAFTSAAVTGKLLTGYTSGAGTVADSDTILQGINKLNGNTAAHTGATAAHGISGAVVGTTDTQALTNKDYQGGTASDTSRITIPKAATATLNALTRKEATLTYDTTAKKLKVDDGSALKVVGGGLIPVAIGIADFTTGNYNAVSGYHYTVNMTGVGTDSYTITLPDGAQEAVVRISVENNDPDYPLVVKQYDGSDHIYYNSVDNDDVSFTYESQWAEVTYDGNGSHWIVNDGSSPISGSFNGSLIFTGYVTLPGSLRLIGYTTSASTPSTTELPASLDAAIHRNSADGKVYLAFNYGGSIKKVELA